ncbi:MAG: fused MFS/spermidine synthase [Dechloromonas sp.]|nr:fused MFS/spermidine synthase [Dechloromonas sp.]
MKNSRPLPKHPVDISEADGVRYLHFGSEWVQGAMRIARPWSLELEYTREMMFSLLLREPLTWPRSALLVGLGAGSLARFIYRYLPDCKITAVEINPQVEFIARQYFRLPEDARLRVRIGCAADYILAGGPSFDLILSDGFDAHGRPGILDSQPFYQACRARLTPNGLFCVNLLREKGFASSVDRIQKTFDGKTCILPPCASGNTQLFAHGGAGVDVSFSELAERAAQLKTATRLKLQDSLQRLQAAHPAADTLRF